MFEVLDKKFSSWTNAVVYADSIGEKVFCEGRCVWFPPVPVSAKRLRMHEEHLAAFKAQWAAATAKKAALKRDVQ